MGAQQSPAHARLVHQHAVRLIDDGIMESTHDDAVVPAEVLAGLARRRSGCWVGDRDTADAAALGACRARGRSQSPASMRSEHRSGRDGASDRAISLLALDCAFAFS